VMNGKSFWIERGAERTYEGSIMGAQILKTSAAMKFMQSGCDYEVRLEPVPGSHLWKGTWVRDGQDKGHCEAKFYASEDHRFVLFGRWVEDGTEYAWIAELG